MKSSLYNKTYNKRLLPISKRFTKICEVMESESDSNYYSNYVENSKNFDTMMSEKMSESVEDIEKLIKNLLVSDITCISRNFKNYKIEYAEESNNYYYSIEISLYYDETHLYIRTNDDIDRCNVELQLQFSFYEKFKDELNLLIIKNKKENFLNSLERFYHHTGLNRKDKIEKLLK